jgi:dimethylargininase
VSVEFSRAIVRPPSRSLVDCELLHLARQPIHFDRALAQHHGYVKALEATGVAVTVLPAADDLPDATFVEDVLLLLDRTAILCRPGVKSREPEVERMRRELTGLPFKQEIRAPGTVDGGDVLCIGRTVFVGESTRTNSDGIRQLRSMAAPLGFTVTAVPISASLHLKTAITSPAQSLLITNPAWADLSAFRGFEILAIPSSEPWGANTLSVNGRVLVAASAPRTADLLRAKGLAVSLVDISELQKAEAGLTCLSVLYP